MQDNEGGLPPLVNGLARMWKNFLKKDVIKDFGVDAVYTLPVVHCLLKDFKEKIESADAEPSFAYFATQAVRSVLGNSLVQAGLE